MTVRKSTNNKPNVYEHICQHTEVQKKNYTKYKICHYQVS